MIFPYLWIKNMVFIINFIVFFCVLYALDDFLFRVYRVYRLLCVLGMNHNFYSLIGSKRFIWRQRIVRSMAFLLIDRGWLDRRISSIFSGIDFVGGGFKICTRHNGQLSLSETVHLPKYVLWKMCSHLATKRCSCLTDPYK